MYRARERERHIHSVINKIRQFYFCLLLFSLQLCKVSIVHTVRAQTLQGESDRTLNCKLYMLSLNVFCVYTYVLGTQSTDTNSLTHSLIHEILYTNTEILLSIFPLVILFYFFRLFLHFYLTKCVIT